MTENTLDFYFFKDFTAFKFHASAHLKFEGIVVSC